MYKQYMVKNPKLTKREAEVLKCLLEGYNNVTIAEKLSITIHTVKAHVSSILAKFDVTDRTQAVIKALKSNLINM